MLVVNFFLGKLCLFFVLIFQQSLSDFDGTHPSASLCFPGNKSLDGVREDEPTTNFGPVHAGWSGSRQSGSRPSASNKEQRRANRLSTVSDGVTGHRRSWIGGNRLSLAGDQLGFSNNGQHPVIGLNIGATRPSKITHARVGGATVPPAADTDFQPREDLRELSITGRKQCDYPLEGRATKNTPAGTDASTETLGKDEHRHSDMEVNFESEGDIFGMESSGDELNSGARDASRELSEPSVRTNDNYSSMVSDSDNSTLSINGDQTLVQRLSEYPFVNTNVFNASLNIRESGSDLSWDEYADVPSFANPGPMYSGCS